MQADETDSGATDCRTSDALSAKDDVDILVVVDNSGSMKEEQQSLGRALPNLVQAISKGELLDGDTQGTVRFPPARSVHVGVVSTDMGINGAEGIDGCGGAGNNAVLLGRTSNQPPYLAYDANLDSAAVVRDVAGRVSLGTDGCGFEQQLEAMWKSLAPASDKSFTAGTGGQGDGKNKGFLRETSLLIVLLVTDEDDCSIPDSSRGIFEPVPEDPKFQNADGRPQGVDSRCALHAEDGTLHPVSRYVEGLKSLRRSNPDRLVFAAITGIPSRAADLLEEDGSQNFQAILDLPEMQIRFSDQIALNSAAGTYPDPACETPSGKAAPARRIVEVASGFGPRGLVRSICSPDFGFAISAVTKRVAKSLQDIHPPDCTE